MKKLITFLFASSLLCLTYGQTFHVLSEDPAGDHNNLTNDVERISVAIDPQSDSLWLRLDFHQTLSGDVGFVFGIDTDLDPATGSHAWDGVQTGLMCEEIIIINRNSFDPTFFYGSATIGSAAHDAIALGDTSILVRLKLSLVDSDGIFNMICGSGNFDAALTNRKVRDEVPTMGWLMISPNVSVEAGMESIGFQVFPQPASSLLYVNIDRMGAASQPAILTITDLQGKVLLRKAMEPSMALDVSSLPSGTYTAQLKLQDHLVNRLITVRH